MNHTDPAPDSLLRHRPFILFWNARVSAAIAFQMVGVAMGWQMYALTGSALDLGLVGLAQFLPATVLFLVAGQLADRYDRRRIAQISQAVESIAAATLAYGALTGTTTREMIFAAAFLLGAGRAGESPTMQTLLPAVVPVPMFPRAVAASSSAQQAATIAGPAVGGLIYAFNPTAVYAICFLLFAAAATQLAFLRYERAASRSPVTLEGFFAGLTYMWRNKILLGIMTMDLFAVFLGGATALLPIFAKDVFDAGPQGLGILRAAPAVGALLISVSLARWSFSRNVGRIEFLAVAVFGVATMVFAVSGSFWLSWAALALMGGADAISVVIRVTLLQLQTPDEMRGRVTAVNSLFISMSNQLGDFRAGAVAAWIGAVPAVLVGGVGALADRAALHPPVPRAVSRGDLQRQTSQVTSRPDTSRRVLTAPSFRSPGRPQSSAPRRRRHSAGRSRDRCRGGLHPTEQSLRRVSSPARIFTTAPCSRSTIGFGVPAGANSPFQPLASKPRRPASSTVGTRGQAVDAPGPADGDRAQLPAFDERLGGADRREHHRHTPGDEIGDRRRTAAIRHMLHLQSGVAREQRGREMRDGAGAGRPVVEPGFRLGVGDELAERLRRYRGMHDHHQEGRRHLR